MWVNLFLRLCLRGGELVWRLPGMGGGERPPGGSDPGGREAGDREGGENR